MTSESMVKTTNALTETNRTTATKELARVSVAPLTRAILTPAMADLGLEALMALLRIESTGE